MKISLLSRHFVRSSICPAIKCHLLAVLDSAHQFLGSGDTINFWRDKWLSQPIVDVLNIPTRVCDL